MSDLDRRAFLKTLGLFGGAAAFSSLPLKENSKELTRIVREANANRSPALRNRPFWVKAADEITLGMGELRDDYDRWNPIKSQFGSFEKYVGEERAAELQKLEEERTIKWLKEGKPGYSLRDRALANAANLVNMVSGPFGGDDTGIQQWQAFPWTQGLRKQAAGSGVKYEAPPSIAARDVKRATRLFGGTLVGVTELDRRMVYSHHRGKPIVFEKTEKPYSDEEKYVIPERFNRVVVIANRMSPETHARSPRALNSAATRMGYSGMSWISGSTAEFIRGLGYEAVPVKNNFAQNVALAVRAGLGELGRTNRLITPEYGALVRLSAVFTDLPMQVDTPIDAGIAEFCVRCKKCAEACPSNALSFEDQPSFDKPEGYEWNNSGHKTWWPDQTKCYSYWQEATTGCGICHTVCPWSKKDRAWLHEFVKVTASATPAFDRFFRTMDDAFGYGVKNTDAEQEKWWELDLPDFGYDTSHGHRRV